MDEKSIRLNETPDHIERNLFVKKPIIGIALIILSLFMLMGFFNADLEAGFLVKLLSLVITVALPLAGGSYIILSHYKDKEKFISNKNDLRNKTLQAEILKLAELKGGKLTVVEVMSNLAVSNDTARKLLDSMASQSLAEVELTESGVIVYSFYEIEHLKDKQRARGVLDA